jgi:phage recombination protein Bet
MSTELDLSHPELAPAPTTLFYGYTQQQVDLVKRTLMPRGATDDELALFLSTANRMGLDPFANQIRAIRRKEYNADTKQYTEKISIEPGIDGFRLVAARTRELEGRLGPYWCGPDGKWVDAWLRDDPPAAAKVGILRRGYREPLVAVAHWREYRQTKRDGAVTSMWSQRPAGQLAKCAEALALRAAFPHELGGVYTSDEMAQAGRPHTTVPQELTAEVDGEPFEGGMPKAWAIDNVRDPEDAKWLLTQPDIDENYRQAVKDIVANWSLEWTSFWRSATDRQWREALDGARLRVITLTEQSDPGLRTGGVGSMAPGDAGESAPHSPGSDPTSGAGASGGPDPVPDPRRPGRHPDPEPESPPAPKARAHSPMEADRVGAEGAQPDGTEPGAGSRDGATSPPDGPPPPGRASGGTKGDAR